MAERLLDERRGAAQLATPFGAPELLSAFITNPAGARDYIRDTFALSGAVSLRVLDISAITGSFSELLGPSGRDILWRAPPLAVAVPDSVFDRMVAFLHGGESAMGFYHRGSNVVFVRESASSDPERFESLVRHELAHYISYMAREGQSRHTSVTSPGGSETPLFAHWLEEGLADYVSYRATEGSHGLTYRVNVAALALLANRVGEDTLLQAYATGNYSALESAIDREFGPGSFRSLIEASGDSLLAIHHVLRMGGLPGSRPSGIDQRTWDDIQMYATNVAYVYGPWRSP